jgi:hypothetical protein
MPYSVLTKQAADHKGRAQWLAREFATLREAYTYAQGRMRSGWLRDEIDIQDEDGSMNVAIRPY